MGCAASVSKTFSKDRRSSKMTVDSLESNNATDNNIVKKRYGHPAYYKGDGFEVGLRVRV
jgi:hypothetical protein